jgi:uncharacterized protein (UPF0335 family)
MRNVEEEECNYQIAKKQVRNILKTIKNQDENEQDGNEQDKNLLGEIEMEGFTCKLNIVSMRSVLDNQRMLEIG